MKNSPSTPSQSAEGSNGSGFRKLVASVLLVVAGYGVGKCNFDKKDNEPNSNKPDIEDVSKAGDRSKRMMPKGWIPAAGAEELVNLAQCRLLVLNLDSRVISEDEVLKMADKIKKGGLKIDADGIIAQFCIHDEADKKKIKELVAKGFKLRKVEKKQNGSWEMIFTNSLSGDDEEERYLDLNERNVCKILTPKEESELELAREQSQKKKALIEKFKKGKVDEELGKFDVRRIEQEARYQGIENEEIIKELVKSINKLKGSIKSGDGEMEKKKKICELIPHLLKLGMLQDKLDDYVKEKIKNNPNIPVGEFENFIEALAESLGIEDPENCILYQAGITPEDVLNLPKQ